jgi:hypothetical protein
LVQHHRVAGAARAQEVDVHCPEAPGAPERLAVDRHPVHPPGGGPPLGRVELAQPGAEVSLELLDIDSA